MFRYPRDVMHDGRESVIWAGDYEFCQFPPFSVAQPIEHREYLGPKAIPEDKPMRPICAVPHPDRRER